MPTNSPTGSQRWAWVLYELKGCDALWLRRPLSRARGSPPRLPREGVPGNHRRAGRRRWGPPRARPGKTSHLAARSCSWRCSGCWALLRALGGVLRAGVPRDLPALCPFWVCLGAVDFKLVVSIRCGSSCFSRACRTASCTPECTSYAGHLRGPSGAARVRVAKKTNDNYIARLRLLDRGTVAVVEPPIGNDRGPGDPRFGNRKWVSKGVEHA